MKRPPAPMDTFVTPEGPVIVLTMVDLHLHSGAFVFFDTEEEAETWKHARSLEQAPAYHDLHCPTCLGDKATPRGAGCRCWWCQCFPPAPKPQE